MTVSVPYIAGDTEGYLVDALVRHVVRRTGWRYVPSGGRLLLRVTLEPIDDENIGFAFVPKEGGGLTQVLQPNEGRMVLGAWVEILDAYSCATLLGPIHITESVTYDFALDTTNIDVHAFSMGQLEVHNIAQDAALCPLYDRLAEKIVDTLRYNW